MLHKTFLVLTSIFLLLAAGVSQAAPMPAPTCFTPNKFDSRMAGNWEIAEWKVRYSIRVKGKQVCLYGRDVKDDESFEISDLKWSKQVLSATFLMPSTQWRTQSRLTLLDADKLRDEYRNKDGKHTDIWTRRH